MRYVYAAFMMNRTLANKLAVRLSGVKLMPNHVTTASLASGIICAICMSSGSRTSMLFGALFLHFAFILDYLDGEIARNKSLSSRFGMWYDLTADFLVDLFLWTGLAVGALRTDARPVLIVILLVLAAAGSALNYKRMVMEKMNPAPVPPSSPEPQTKTPAKFNLKRSLESLVQDADPWMIFWILALIGSPFIFLSAGTLYILVLLFR